MFPGDCLYTILLHTKLAVWKNTRQVSRRFSSVVGTVTSLYIYRGEFTVPYNIHPVVQYNMVADMVNQTNKYIADADLMPIVELDDMDECMDPTYQPTSIVIKGIPPWVRSIEFNTAIPYNLHSMNNMECSIILHWNTKRVLLERVILFVRANPQISHLIIHNTAIRWCWDYLQLFQPLQSLQSLILHDVELSNLRAVGTLRNLTRLTIIAPTNSTMCFGNREFNYLTPLEKLQKLSIKNVNVRIDDSIRCPWPELKRLTIRIGNDASHNMVGMIRSCSTLQHLSLYCNDTRDEILKNLMTGSQLSLRVNAINSRANTTGYTISGHMLNLRCDNFHIISIIVFGLQELQLFGIPNIEQILGGTLTAHPNIRKLILDIPSNVNNYKIVTALRNARGLNYLKLYIKNAKLLISSLYDAIPHLPYLREIHIEYGGGMVTRWGEHAIQLITSIAYPLHLMHIRIQRADLRISQTNLDILCAYDNIKIEFI
jgi:hypothetical protein